MAQDFRGWIDVRGPFYPCDTSVSLEVTVPGGIFLADPGHRPPCSSNGEPCTEPPAANPCHRKIVVCLLRLEEGGVESVLSICTITLSIETIQRGRFEARLFVFFFRSLRPSADHRVLLCTPNGVHELPVQDAVFSGTQTQDPPPGSSGPGMGHSVRSIRSRSSPSDPKRAAGTGRLRWLGKKTGGRCRGGTWLDSFLSGP